MNEQVEKTGGQFDDNSHSPKAKMTAVAIVKTVASRRRIDISRPRLTEAVSRAAHRLDVVASERAVDLAP